MNFIATNLAEVQRGGLTCVAGVVAITVCLGLLGNALLYMARMRGDDIVVPWTVAICVFFGYLAIRNVFSQAFVRAGLAVPASAGWLLCATLALYFAWRWHRSTRLQMAATTFSLFAVGAAVLALGVALLRSPATMRDPGSVQSAQVAAHGVRGDVNIYYILLDGYAGERSLREVLLFDNAPFMNGMKARGFRDVSSGHSNYLRTEETLGGIFSLQYPHTDDPRSWHDASHLYPGILDTAQAAPLISDLQGDGYTIWFSGSVVAGCPSMHVRCLNEKSAVDGVYITQGFLAPTPLGRMFMHMLARRRNALAPIAEQLSAMLAEHQPFFVFAHHLAPHPPYSLDRNCEPIKSGLEMWEDAPDEQRAGYVGAVECVNAQVVRLVDRIIAADSQALIVLQGDHGSELTMKWKEPMASWTDAAIGERASYLNLVRAPERCARGLDRPLGQINTARFVVACAEARKPAFLPEHSFISTYAHGAEEGVVREWHPHADSAGFAVR